MIAAYCELKDMETAIKVFETMKQSGTTPLAPTYHQGRRVRRGEERRGHDRKGKERRLETQKGVGGREGRKEGRKIFRRILDTTVSLMAI